MEKVTIEFTVKCKRCGIPIGYSGMMYEKMKEFGQSRPEYCEECRIILTAEKMTMGAAYYTLKTIPGADLSVAIPGELGKVYHPDRPHIKVEKPKTFDASKFGATPGKVVEIYEWLKDPKHQVVIVKGGTGSGKSTALPYWLIFPPEGVPADFFIRDGQIVITQPRILATTKISQYLGTLLGSSVGKGFDIGYRYSKDRNADRFNAAFLATDGTLINMIKMGQLTDLGVVMIDEAHERSLNIDIILHLLKDQLPLYPHLKLLIVSATINAESFLEYFGRETATLVEFEPKSIYTYGKENYADESEKLSYEDHGRLKKQLVPALVKKIVWLLNEQVNGKKDRGHVLAFLQGVKPIEEAVGLIRTAVAANPKLKDLVEVLPLYSDLGEKESDSAINITDPAKIRVIVSTNVAEASITVEGIVYVIDSGVENQAQWETEESKKTVELRTISKANARQRWGRAGRTRNGEVFCLYTKKQFEAMPDFPIPAIQRSSMEEIILRLKELGIDDCDKGWIDAPDSKEIDRSVASLQKSGAFDKDDMLTEYGALLSQFRYPASLADLVIMADRFGCAVEIATLLPIIKNGGFRSFLSHDTSWDEPTKQKVAKTQAVLWEGCKDDVEFIVRMYSFWRNPPELADTNYDAKKSLKNRREEWAEAFYVNFGMFAEDIEKEKEQILRLLSGYRKDRSNRNLQFELLARVRMILAFCIPFVPVTDAKYAYNPRLEVADGASASCQLAISTDRAEKILALKKQSVSPLSLARAAIPWEADAEPLDNVLKRLLTKPVVPLLDTEAFGAFVAKYKVGEKLTVDVVGYVEHATDFRISLAVKEPVTGYVTWLTPSDITFTQSSAVIKQIPLGTKLNVLVKAIDLEKSFVRLFCLPLVEVELEKTYRTLKKVDGGQIVTRAKVIEVRTNGQAIFLAELSRPSEGFVLVVQASRKVLENNKPLTDYKVGETVLVKYRVDPEFEYKANLVTVSEKLKAYMAQPNSRLSWIEGKLISKKKITYADWLELSKIDSETGFQAALDYLYLSSYMNWASKVTDSGWLETAKSKLAIGQVLTVTIIRILSVGMMVTLPDGNVGFIRTNSTRDAVKEGETLKAKIISFDEERQQVNLSFAIPENSPLKRYVKNQVLDGVIDNLTDYGAFVSLGFGYSGLIHISKMGRRVSKPSDILAKGDRVQVEILDMREERGRVKISLGLKSVVKST